MKGLEEPVHLQRAGAQACRSNERRDRSVLETQLQATYIG